jgi:dolichol-phosphate mannosyltransferase
VVTRLSAEIEIEIEIEIELRPARAIGDCSVSTIDCILIRVALPAYNEEEALPLLLDRMAVVAAAHFPGRFEVLVVDDGSKDKTAAVVEAFAASHDLPVHLIRHGVNKGLGEAIKTGLRAAAERSSEHDVIITMDSDDTHIPGLIPRMAQLIEEGNDVVIASRYQAGARMMGIPWFRQVLSAGLSLMFQVVFPIPGARDYSCGYRAYRPTLIQQAFAQWGERFISERGFACMVDILMRLHKLGAIVTEVPMVLRYDRKPGATKMPVRRTIKETFGLLLRRRLGDWA